MKKFIGSVVCACFLMVLSTSAYAINYEEWVDSVVTAADAMVAAQNNNGTFDWTQDTNPAIGGAMNTQGATGRGLVAAYNVTGNTIYLEAANKAANWLQANSTGLYNKDIEFLYELAAAGGTDYTGFASNQAVNYINAKITETGASSGAQAIYNRYLGLNWSHPTINQTNLMNGGKLWMIGEWGHVAQLLGNTEIYTGYTGYDMAEGIGDLMDDFYLNYDPDNDPTTYASWGTLGLVGMLEGMYFGGGVYSNEQDALDTLWNRSTTGWQDTGYKTYVLSLYGINEPGQLTNWINADYFDTATFGVNLEIKGEALLGVASAPVPEPATLLLLGLGLLGVAGVSRRKI
jgi:hypothetical protein